MTDITLKKIIGHIRKEVTFLLKNNCLNFFEKIKVIASRNKKRTIRDLLLKRLSKSKEGLNFFSICGYKIYFQPDYEISDKDYFLTGITKVLAETFIFPVFFSSNVCIKSGDIVLDVGASIGTTALLFSKIVGKNGKVFAFEPVTHDIIYTNIQENNIKNIEVIPKGVSHKADRVEIEISDFCLDSSAARREYTKDYYTDKRMIDVISLDSFAEDMEMDRIDFIKMDIEGLEELAIKGAKKIIDKYRPKWSISSYHVDFNNEPQHDKLVKLLKESGYTIDEIKGFHIYAWQC